MYHEYIVRNLRSVLLVVNRRIGGKIAWTVRTIIFTESKPASLSFIRILPAKLGVNSLCEERDDVTRVRRGPHEWSGTRKLFLIGNILRKKGRDGGNVFVKRKNGR